MEGNADKLVEKGKKALSTGIMKWSKDYVSAAIYFDQAASIYKTNGQYDKAIGVYEQLVTVNKKLNDNWATAKNYENIIDCQFLRDKNSLSAEKVLQLCDTAIDMYAMENSLNSIFTVMDKLAK
jgi:hypothetical protein